MKARIEVDNHLSCINTDLKTLHAIQESFKLKAANYFYSPAWRSRSWDGKVKYINDKGFFTTGLLPRVLEWFEKNKANVSVEDLREPIEGGEVVAQVGNMKLRDYQLETITKTLESQIYGIRWQRGIWNMATNAGKNLIAASLFASYGKDYPTLFLVNRSHIYEQAQEEIGGLFPGHIGFIGPGGNMKLNTFTVAMAQTLVKNLKKYAKLLENVEIVLVDECHYASSDSYKKILKHLENSYVRIGMSGTALKHKDENKNRAIEGFFGPVLNEISNKELVDLGFSTPPKITIVTGNKTKFLSQTYPYEENNGIIHNSNRNNKVFKRVEYHMSKGRLPMLIMAQKVEHVELLYKKAQTKFPNLRISMLHVHTPKKERTKILKDFKTGHTDILVSSQLIKEGQNLPLIRAAILAGGGKSTINTLQILGRMLRSHESKKKVYIDDFYDMGKYLRPHSKARIKTYRNEKFEVKILAAIR